MSRIALGMNKTIANHLKYISPKEKLNPIITPNSKSKRLIIIKYSAKCANFPIISVLFLDFTPTLWHSEQTREGVHRVQISFPHSRHVES